LIDLHSVAVYLTKRSNNILQLKATISLKKIYIQFELHSNLFNASHVPLVFEKQNSIETLTIPSLFRSNYTKMPLFSSKLDHTIYPDLLLVIEAPRYEMTSFSLPVAQPRILFGRTSQWSRQSL